MGVLPSGGGSNPMITAVPRAAVAVRADGTARKALGNKA
jgi:hypothetical protein